jgi:hypothetical protein
MTLFGLLHRAFPVLAEGRLAIAQAHQTVAFAAGG